MGYKLGIDFSHKTEEDLQYLVFPPALDYTSGSYALQGKYFGTKVSAEAAVVMGAQLLLGGFNKSFTLQPPGACPRISLLFKIKAFSKNTHSHIGNISESRTSLTGALFLEITQSLDKMAFSDKLLAAGTTKGEGVSIGLGYLYLQKTP